MPVKILWRVIFYLYFCSMKHLIPIIGILLLASCHTLDNGDMQTDIDSYDETLDEMDDFFSSCFNSVAGHDERDTIVGNFTGRGIDTIYVVESERDTTKNMEESVSYYAVSNNERIPTIELYGYPKWPPRLVFEGDLDGNGTDEWGYLHTWINSQWRYYRVFTLVDGEWRYLVESDKLDTPEWFRCSGKEVIEPAGQKGYVKIHYGTWSPDYDFRDTIEKVTYSKIND